MYKQLIDNSTSVFIKKSENLECFLKLLKVGLKD